MKEKVNETGTRIVAHTHKRLNVSVITVLMTKSLKYI